MRFGLKLKSKSKETAPKCHCHSVDRDIVLFGLICINHLFSGTISPDIPVVFHFHFISLSSLSWEANSINLQFQA